MFKLPVRRPVPDHLHVPWGVKDALVVYFAAWVVMPALIVVMLVALAAVVPPANGFLKSLTQNSIEANFALTLMIALAGLGLVALYLRRYKAGWQAVGWRSFDLAKAALYLLVIFFVFIFAAMAALQLVSWLDPSFNADQPQNNELIDGASRSPTLALLGLVFIAPIIEETVFRGFVFPALAKRWGFWIGAVSSSILFGLAHLQANVGIYTFVLGILLCFMYARLRSIFPGMALHMLNNYLAFIALTGK